MPCGCREVLDGKHILEIGEDQDADSTHTWVQV